MPAHDWTKVDAAYFHDFHTAWITHLKESLNEGLLPAGYYAASEQHIGGWIADVLTLHVPDRGPPPPRLPGNQGIALADAPPRISHKLVADKAAYRKRQRALTIRHVSSHGIVALVEIVSPANKDRPTSVKDFAEKVDSVLLKGIHVLVADLFPPGKHDPQGIHGAIWTSYSATPCVVPSDQPLTLVSYRADGVVEAYIEHLKVGDPLTDMPLFLDADYYINIPLELTYQMAYRGLPAYWRDEIEGRQEAT